MSSESDYARRAARFYGAERVRWSRQKRTSWLQAQIAETNAKADAFRAERIANCKRKKDCKGFCFCRMEVLPEDIRDWNQLKFMQSLIWHEEQDELYARRAQYLIPVEYADHIDGFCRYWQNLRHRLFVSVDYKCERCGKPAQLDAHHLHYDTLGFEELCDLQALCRGCHEGTHRGGHIERLRQFVQHRE